MHAYYALSSTRVMQSIDMLESKKSNQPRNLSRRVGALFAWVAGLLATFLVLMAEPLRAQVDYNNAVVGYTAVSDGVADPTYSYNAAGGDITVSHPDTGQYIVAFEGAGGILEGGGHVQVTPVGTPDVQCAVHDWSGDPDLEVGVLCENLDGDWIDSNFTILLVDKFAPGPGHNENLAFARTPEGPLSPGDVIDLSSESTTHNPGGSSTILHYDGDGIFRIIFEDLANAFPTSDVGYPQVSLFEDSITFISRLCRPKNGEWVGSDYEVRIVCSQFNGLPSSSPFNLLLTSGEEEAPGYAYASVPPAVEISSDWTELSTSYNPFGSVEIRKDSPDMVHVRFNGLNTEGQGGIFLISSPGICTIDNWGTIFGIHFVSVAGCGGSPFNVLSTFVDAVPQPIEDEIFNDRFEN